ncbi:MAG: putative membrane protein [Pseudohongiellaceae bacterium]
MTVGHNVLYSLTFEIQSDNIKALALIVYKNKTLERLYIGKIMTQKTITIHEKFNAPIAQVFGTLSDHEKFGKICGINMKRIHDGDDGLNGKGSVRTIKIGPLPSFEETITDFIPNEFIEYKITKGSPIKNHVGTLTFSEQNNQTVLDYEIKLESKIPFTASIIKTALQNGIVKGLRKYSKTL